MTGAHPGSPPAYGPPLVAETIMPTATPPGRESVTVRPGRPGRALHRAGHGIAVLLKIYAHCIDGQADGANQRITDALTSQEPVSGNEAEDATDQTA
jgi:hypothetical protein